MKIKSVLFLLVLTFSQYVSADGFSYTNLGINFGEGGYKRSGYYERADISYVDIMGRYQFSDYFALSYNSGTYVIEIEDDKNTRSNVSLLAEFPISINKYMDLVPLLGHKSRNYEDCYRFDCYTSSESAWAYGLRMRLWVMPDTIELFASSLDSDSEIIQIETKYGAYFWFREHHSVGYLHADDKIMSSSSIGYRYTW